MLLLLALYLHNALKGRKGRKQRAIPVTAISAAQKMNMVEKGSASAATKPIAKGSRNWAMEMESFVKMFAMVPFSLKISMQLGVMLTSEEAVGRAGADAEYVGQRVAVRSRADGAKKIR